MSGNPFPSVPTFLVDNKGVHKLLLDLNPHKAQGPDNIPTRFLKEFARDFSSTHLSVPGITATGNGTR